MRATKRRIFPVRLTTRILPQKSKEAISAAAAAAVADDCAGS